MRLTVDNPWRNRVAHSGLVSLGHHSLWASVSGPARTSRSPLLIFITGAGASTAVYVKLQEALSAHVRVLFYDRAGYDQSTLPPASSLPNGKVYAMDTARDLTKLLRETQLEPPYIVAAHSYGGIIARSFLELHKDNPDTVAGMLLIDCATELMLQLFPRVPAVDLMAVAKNVDWEELTHLKEQSGMSDDEWKYAMEAQERCIVALKLEDTHASAHQLALHHQLESQTLGDRPLLVLRFNIAVDYQMLYDEGVRLGDGTEEERKQARFFMETFGLFHPQIAMAQCGLSRNVVFRYSGCWEHHDLPIRRPALVVEEVKMFLNRMTTT
jgi:pimeloyl-ACP methyl ester carboxylesterase